MVCNGNRVLVVPNCDCSKRGNEKKDLQSKSVTAIVDVSTVSVFRPQQERRCKQKGNETCQLTRG